MTGFAEYGEFDGIGLAELIRSGQVSVEEVTAEAIDRAEAVNPSINAIITPMYDQARERAHQPLPDSVLSGVPILLKDMRATYAGVRTSGGSRLLAHTVADRDSELVSRLRAAGLNVIGKTNTSEFGLSPTTEPRYFGPTRNPWDPSLSPGGSSGGSAAAVAAGVVPAAHGSDGGGSLRIPASCCGLFGLKPTRGRNPAGPQASEVWNGLGAEHAITRTVRDSAALLDITAGPEAGAPYWAPPTPRALDAIRSDPPRLRIAASSRPHWRGSPHPQAQAAFEDAVELCQSLGHIVEDVPFLTDGDSMERQYRVILEANVDAMLQAYADAIPGALEDPAAVEAVTRSMAAKGSEASSADLVRAIQHGQSVGRALGEFFLDWDVMLTPTLAEPPPPLGSISMAETDLDRYWDRISVYFPYTALYNITGAPAMSVPLYWDAANLPIGVQFGAAFGNEVLLFQLAAQLERARPWFHRTPPASNTRPMHHHEGAVGVLVEP